MNGINESLFLVKTFSSLCINHLLKEELLLEVDQEWCVRGLLVATISLRGLFVVRLSTTTLPLPVLPFRHARFFVVRLPVLPFRHA